MQTIRSLKNLKSHLVGSGTLTAGGTGDATAVAGVAFDHLPQGEQSYLAGKLLIPYTATLAAGKKLAFTVTEDESDDGSTYTTAVKLKDAVTVATGATGGSTETGIVEIEINLAAKKKNVRYNITPDLDATGTDTARWSAVLVAQGTVEA